MALRIIIADDHPMLIDGLITVLREIEDVDVPLSVSNGRQLLDVLAQTGVDIVMLDLNMPKMDGVDTLRRVKKDFPHVRVIVFTSYNQPKLIADVRALGADGYLLKTSTSVTIKDAFRSVAAGNKWFPGEPEPAAASDKLSDEFIRKSSITKREVEIIRMIARGLTTRNISEQMSLSEFTVNAHRRNICRKLNIYTPVGLLNFAKEHGLA